MYIVYVLYSAKYSRSYVGKTDNLVRRLGEHNSSKTLSTKAYMPWMVVHSEAYFTHQEARDREKFLKTAAGRKWRKKNVALPSSILN